MSLFKNFDWSTKSIAKIIGVVFLGVIAFAIIIALISFSFRTLFQGGTYYGNQANYDKGAYDYAVTQEAGFAPSVNRLGIVPPRPGYSTGADAEAYEVKTYSATVKTRRLKKTCEAIAVLKGRDDVIFETANQNDDNCYFSFKVKKEVEAEVLAVVESLKPEDINVNTQTIKGTIEGIDKQLEILNSKLASVEETLEDAQDQYDQLQRLATSRQDVESLTKIIDSKLNLLERLTGQRLQIKTEIDQYNQSKQDQLDRLNYSFFNVNIIKDLIFDWKQIKDSWKYEAKAFVDNFNSVIQGISLQLGTYFIRVIQVAIYLFITVFLLKYAWVAAKRIWHGKRKK